MIMGWGEKRKILDNMIIDGGEEQLDLGSKKVKTQVPLNSGSDVSIVEAEVGMHQPLRVQ